MRPVSNSILRKMTMTKPKPKPRGLNDKPKIPPVAEVEIASSKVGPKKSSDSTAGLFSGVAELPFDYLGSKKAHWKLSLEERKWLNKSVAGVTENFGLDEVDNPNTLFFIVIVALVIPRIILDLMENYESKRQQPKREPSASGVDTDQRDQRKTESDNHSIRQEGPGQNAIGLDALPSSAGQKGPLNSL